MAWDWGGSIGGGLSGAASGSAIAGPWGAVAGGLAGLVGGGISGGSTPTYEPSPLQQALSDYATQQVTAGPKTRKSITSYFKSLRDTGNRGAAESFLESYRNTFSNPDFIEKKLAKSYKSPIDYSTGGYWDTANQLYSQQGLGFSAQNFGNFVNQAKARSIRSPQAFGDMLKADLIAGGKVMTPQQEMLSYMFGEPGRDQTGKITNLYTPIKEVNPAEVGAKLADMAKFFGPKTQTTTITTQA